MSRDTRAWLLLVTAVAVGALAAGWWLHRTPAPLVRYKTVTVTPQEIRQDKPDADPPSVRERITTRREQPEQVAIAPKAALPEVSAYCAAYARSQVATLPPRVDTVRDTLVRVDTVPAAAPRPILPPLAIAGDPGHLSLWLPLSDGSEWRGDYRVGRHYTGVTDADSLVVRSRRGDALVRWGGRVLWMGLGAAAGYLAGR